MAFDRKAYNKEWRARNKEQYKKTCKAWYEDNKEKKIANVKTWYEANKEKHNSNVKAWQQNNKAYVNSISKRYKESKRDNNYITTELDKFVEKEMYELAQIRTKQTGFNWEVDHIQPLSKGGKHAIDNLQVVPADWNRSKGNRNSNVYRGTT